MSQLSLRLSLPLMYIYEPQSHLTSVCQCPIIHVVAQTHAIIDQSAFSFRDETINLVIGKLADKVALITMQCKNRQNELHTITYQISLNEKLPLSAALNDTVMHAISLSSPNPDTAKRRVQGFILHSRAWFLWSVFHLVPSRGY